MSRQEQFKGNKNSIFFCLTQDSTAGLQARLVASNSKHH